MKPNERKAAMLLAGVPAAQIARELKVSQSHVSMVVNGQRASRRVEEAIAGAIGLPVDYVFPPPVREGAAA